MEELKVFNSQEEIDRAESMLLENPNKIVPIIDKHYGQGMSAKILNGGYKYTPPEEPSFLENALDQVVDVFQGVGRGIIGAPTEMLETTANANAMGEDEGQALYDKTINYRNEVLAKRGLPPMTLEEEQEFAQRMGVGLAAGGIAVRDERVDFDTQDVVDAMGLTEALEVDTMAGTLAEGFSQFVSGYAMLGGGGGVLRSLTTGAAVDAAAFDPYDRNISAIMEENEWIIPIVTEALATDADSSEWENRLRNSVEGGILGVALEGTVATIKHFTKVKKAQTELSENGEVSEATMKELQEAEAEVTKFADLDAKPRGQVVEGKFVTDDGMIFDMNTGAREFELEANRANFREYGVDSKFDTKRPEAPEAPQSNFNELFESMGEEGALAEYPSIGASLDDYVYNNNRSRIDDILNDPDYEEYKQVLTASLQRQFGDQSIPVTRIEGYSDVNAEKVANDFEVQMDDIIAVGNESELELLVRMDDGEIRSVRLNNKPRVQDPQGVAKAPETAPTAPKKPKPLVNTDVLVKAAKDAAKTKKPTTYNIQGERIGLFNWDNMEGPQDALKIMNSIGDTLSASGAMKNIEPQSLESINRAAMTELKDLTGADLPALTARFSETAKNTSDLAVQLVAGKTALQSTGRRISQLVDELDALEQAGRYNSDVEERLIDAMQLHADMQAAVKNIQTSAARATAAGRIRTADNITDAALNKVERFGGSKRLKKLAKQIKAAPTDAAKAKLVRKGIERTWLGKAVDVVNEVWLNAILSGPHTHALNIGANSINMMVRPAIRMIGGAATANPQQIEEGFRQYMYLTNELANSIKTIATVGQYGGDTAIKNMMRSWWREEGILDTANKFDGNFEGANRAISSQTLGGGSVVDFTGKAMRLAGRTLQAEDEMFKQLVFNSRLQAKVVTGARRMTDEQIQAAGYASREDYISGEIAKAKESQESLAEKWQMMVQTGKVMDDAEAKAAFIQKHVGAYNHNSKYAQDALAEARETTFTTPLQNGTFSKYIQDMMTKIPILRQIMPFIQTPTNILRTSFERAPILNFAMKKQREIFLRGTPEERAIIAGNFSVGVATTLLAVNYAMQGRITGGGPSYTDEADKAKLWNASPDWQPYSVNIGTAEEPQWIELKKLDPHGFLFGIIGDIYEMQQYIGDTKDPELTKLTAMVVASFSNNVMSKTYMMSLSDTLNIFDGSAKPYQIDQFLQNRAASMVPYSQLSYQLNQDMDDSARELRSLTDKVKARIYGQNNAAVKHDWLTGEDVGTPEYMLGFVRQKKVDSGEHKAAKVYSELRKLNHAFVGPQKKIGDITLSPEVFQRYNELVGTVQMTGRRTLLEQIEKTIDSRAYQKLTEQAEIEQLRSADDPRVKLINQVIQLYKKRAQAQLYKEFPELAQAVNENKAIRKTIQAGGDASLSDNLIFEFPPK